MLKKLYYIYLLLLSNSLFAQDIINKDVYDKNGQIKEKFSIHTTKKQKNTTYRYIYKDVKTNSSFDYEKTVDSLGKVQSVSKMIAINFKIDYPISAREKNIEGKVYVQGIFTADCRLRNTKIRKSLSPDCDAEALKMIPQIEAFYMKIAKFTDCPCDDKLPSVFPVSFRLD